MDTSHHSKRILIVEDERDVRLLLTKMFRMRGYTVSTAENGTEAIRLAGSFAPDAILMDIMLPDMQGDNVAEVLAEKMRTRDIPVVFLTALLTKEEEQHRRESPHNQIMFAKPYDPDELLETVDQIVCRQAARRVV
jgi:CheY-like chemotaxis protein